MHKTIYVIQSFKHGKKNYKKSKVFKKNILKIAKLIIRNL